MVSISTIISLIITKSQTVLFSMKESILIVLKELKMHLCGSDQPHLSSEKNLVCVGH